MTSDSAESEVTGAKDAQENFLRWKNEDPFPSIAPALLNSADIHDYIETTGMLAPYDASLLKSSSYEARIGNYAYYWDEEGKRVDVNLRKDTTVKLKPKSLVFFETKEEFRLPAYMAVRFNLRITNVHRGLLLGTGPLVDPGFEGKLLIPIHNLTNNEYTFEVDECFIWVEFTKVSENKSWQYDGEEIQRRGEYKPFPERKKNQISQYYFEKLTREIVYKMQFRQR